MENILHNISQLWRPDFFFYALKFRALRCFGQNLTFRLNFIKKQKEKCVHFCNFKSKKQFNTTESLSVTPIPRLKGEKDHTEGNHLQSPYEMAPSKVVTEDE